MSKKDMQSLLALTLGAAMMGGDGIYGEPFGQPTRRPYNREPRRREKVVPVGTTKYYFAEDGEWRDGPKTIPHVFECIASNPKNAIRKFNNFKKAQG